MGTLLSFSQDWRALSVLGSLCAAFFLYRYSSTRRAVTVVAATLVVVFLAPLVSQFGTAFSLIRGIHPLKVVLVVAVFQLQFISAGIVLRTAAQVPGSPLRFAAAMYASSLYSRVGPSGIGGWAYETMFLRRRGLSKEAASAAVVAKVSTTAFCNLSILVVASAVAATSGKLDIPIPVKVAGLVVVAATLLLVAAFFFRSSRAVQAALTFLRDLAAKLFEIFTNPRQALPMVIAGWSMVAIQVTTAVLALVVCGYNGSVMMLIPVILLATSAAAATPAPGGLGATEAAFLAAYAVVGIAAPVALSAVAVMRFANFWFTLIPAGICALCDRVGKEVSA